MINILGVNIPKQMVTTSISRCDWRIEPIGNMDNINPRWVGGRRSQVKPSMILVLWRSDDASLVRREKQFVEDAELLIETFNDSLTLEAEKPLIRGELLATLRLIFLVKCLLCQKCYSVIKAIETSEDS